MGRLGRIMDHTAGAGAWMEVTGAGRDVHVAGAPPQPGEPHARVVANVIEARSDAAGTVTITFRLPPEANAERINVVGEFNRWSNVATPMERDDDGFVARISLPVGRTYRFRYLLDGQRWENDWAADCYVANEFGGDDSVIDLTMGGSRAGTVHAACPPTQ